MNGIDFESVQCPWCGESFEAAVDASAGDSDYVEDCAVCCRPILLHLRIDDDGTLRLSAERE